MEKMNGEIFSSYLSSKFIDILQKYCADRIKEERTQQQYIYVFNAICDYAGCDFLEMTQEAIKSYFSQKERDGAILSTDFNLSVLRAVSRFMDENAEALGIEPVYLNLFSILKVTFPDMQFHMEDLPELGEIDKVLAFFKSQGDLAGFLSCSMVLRMSLTTNELVSLKRNMLLQDADGNCGIRFMMTDYAYRYVKLPSDIKELIEQYAKQRSDKQPYFFLNRKGKPASARALQNRLHDACLASGVKPFTYNDLRTLSQAIMLRDGAPLDKVAEYVNVKNLSWFFRYNRVVEAFKNVPVDYMHIKIVW